MLAARSLLVIDPDPLVRELLSDVLKKEGRIITSADDGRQAVERLRAEPYEVVLASQSRNGMDNLKLLRRMRSVRPQARVILAGDSQPARVIGAIRGHAYSYFHHPLPTAPLADMVQLALDTVSWQDDIQVLSARPEWITLDVRCKLEAAERTTHFLREIEADLPAQTREDVAAAFRELLLNAIEHGGNSDPKKRARVSLLRTSRSLIVHIHDPGKGFSLDFLPHAAICNPQDSPTRHVEVRAEEGKRPGGFGILMSRNLVDDLIYNERGNAVLFVKYF